MLARLRHTCPLSFAVAFVASSASAQALAQELVDPWSRQTPEILDPWADAAKPAARLQKAETLDPWRKEARASFPLLTDEIVDPWNRGGRRAAASPNRLLNDEIIDPWKNSSPRVPTAVFPSIDDRRPAPRR
jgi:hypothetical protein